MSYVESATNVINGLKPIGICEGVEIKLFKWLTKIGKWVRQLGKLSSEQLVVFNLTRSVRSFFVTYMKLDICL